MGLSREQMFVKKEATSGDIALLLQTLWRRHEDIPSNPATRVSFHATVLLAAIGGFRPGVCLGIKYKQVALNIVRHPLTNKKRLVASFTLYQNKVKKNVIQTGQTKV